MKLRETMGRSGRWFDVSRSRSEACLLYIMHAVLVDDSNSLRDTTAVM